MAEIVVCPLASGFLLPRNHESLPIDNALYTLPIDESISIDNESLLSRNVTDDRRFITDT